MAKHQCPLWGEPLTISPITAEGVYLVYSPRAGGVYGLPGSWGVETERGHPIAQLGQATPRQKANLSHWIYRQNLEAGLLWPPEGIPESARHDVMGWGVDTLPQQAPSLDYDTVMAQYARPPSALHRRLYLLNELLLQQDIPLPIDKTKLRRVYADYTGFRAAAAAWDPEPREENEFWDHLEKEGWVRIRPSPVDSFIPVGDTPSIFYPAVCTLDARLWVEEHTRRDSLSQQGFIAMWFNEDIRKQIAPTIEKAIQDAGYTPLLIIRDLRTHSIPDQIVHQLRQSRFVVADLTSHLLADNDELGRRNVYYEAGFAAGADLEVIFTCRKNCYAPEKVASDIRHFNVVCWDNQDLESFRQELQERILARVRPGRDYVNVHAADN